MRLASLLRLPFSISDACRLDCAADDAEPDAPSAPSPSPSPPHRLRDARSDRPLMQHSSSASVSPPANAASSPRLTIGKSPFAQAHLFDKLCAGLLLFSGGEVLLIQRSSKYNDLCWDIPGGQIDPGDITADEAYRTQLATLAPAQQRQQVLLYPGNAAPTDRHGYGVGSGTWLAAAREAREELGSLPSPVSVISAHLCTRGDGSKRYTLYVCRLDRAVRARFKPTLSEEHSAWGWFPPAALAALVERGGGFSLHPWYAYDLCFIYFICSVRKAIRLHVDLSFSHSPTFPPGSRPSRPSTQTRGLSCACPGAGGPHPSAPPGTLLPPGARSSRTRWTGLGP